VVRHRVPCAVAGLAWDGIVLNLGPCLWCAGPVGARARCQRGRAHVQPQLPVRRGWQLPVTVALAGRLARAPRRSFFVEAP
jgi:hypothetical protein